VFFQLAAYRESVHVRQVQVEDDQVRRAHEELVESHETAGEALDLVAPVLLQVVHEREREILVVLDDGDPQSRGERGARRRRLAPHPNLPVM
jgi:hypothetical protein